MRKLFNILVSIFLLSCSNEIDKITPPEIRAAEAIAELNSKLQAPAQGWKLEYQPTPESGIFQMIIKFNSNGVATINSDLAANNGQFIQQEIPYRIDNALSLELIFETYGAFHYLFELERASFGAEFEFLFIAEDNENLLFSSKSDFSNQTLIALTPATSTDLESFSVELAENINLFDTFTPSIFGGTPPIQHIAITARNASLFWFIDPVRRIIQASFISSGLTESDVINSGDKLALNHVTGYKYSEGMIVLSDPLTFTFLGTDYSIESVRLSDFSTEDKEVCAGSSATFPRYIGEITGVGNIIVSKSFINFEGLQFGPQSDSPYSVNVFFAFDGDFNSLSEEGIIAEAFPNATGIAFNYGFISTEEPENAMGLFLDASDGSDLTYLREFDVVSQVGNRLEIAFTDDFYFSATPEGSPEAGLTTFTDDMFEGGTVYIFDFPSQGNTVFRLYNPCNNYELFLVQ